MVGMRKFKLSDAARGLLKKFRGGKPTPNHATAAEQTREARESSKAGASAPSIRARMINIGRGNQQSGRQGQ